ncbi:MAG: cytochrome P450 [Acidimicrobiales bacterium]
MAEQGETVEDWATDWDHHDPVWVQNPYPIWNELRDRCPVAHTDRYNEGTWLPLRFDDLSQIAHDTESFSSQHDGLTAGGTVDRVRFPPIHSDPPEHQPLRRAVLPFFSPKRIAAWEPVLREHCEALMTSIVARGGGDAAVDYAQHIPVTAIAAILGVDPADGDQFRTWVVDFIEVGARDNDVRERATVELLAYMRRAMERRQAAPSDDLISHLLGSEVDGQQLDDDTIERMLMLQLVAGIDTTWSSIGAALWHLATNDGDRRRLAAEPDLIPTAVEEFLRAYAPVNVIRRVAQRTTVNGVAMHPGDSVLMTFPIACRDPEMFERHDEVIIDRQRNRHPAFGLGIHRCLGSNLARLEMNVAVATWLEHAPEFGLAQGAEVRWSEGQIRGPRTIPVVIGR